MIHKIIKDAYFKGALRYVLDPAKGLLIGGTFGSHQSPSQIAREMHEVAGDRLRKPVFHAVLSLRPGESLSNDRWNEAARRYMASLGYEDVPFVLVRHTNREHDHVHIVASRVRYDGSVVSDRQDRFKGLSAVRELSREFGLSMGSPSSRSRVAAEVRALVRSAAQGRPTFATFLSRLEASGVRVTTHVSPTARKVQGLSFHLDGVTFKASHLGRDLSWSGLQKLGVRYDPKTDLPLVLARSSRQAVSLEGSAWSDGTVRDLSHRLRSLRAESRGGGTAARDLIRRGSEAFRFSAHVARFLEGGIGPSDATRQLTRALSPRSHLSLALSLLGAFRSPGTAALLLLQVARRASTSGRQTPADPGLLFLRQLAHAAAGDRPRFEVFRARLVEAGVHLGPGVFILPDRVVPGREIGLNAVQLERLGVQDARERFGRPDRAVRHGDRDRRDHSGGLEGGRGPAHSGLGTDRADRSESDPATRPARGANPPTSNRDGGAHLGGGSSPQQPQAAGHPDLDDRRRSRPRGESPSPERLDRSAASMVPDRSASGPTPDRTPARGPALSSPGGPAKAPLVSSSGAQLPHELALQLRALGEEGVAIRVRTPERTLTHRIHSPEVLDQMMPSLLAQARQGAALEIRSLDPRTQHLSGVPAEVVELAHQRGVEPAAILRRGDGTFDVWLRHSPSAPPQTLPYLHRLVRAEYGQPPLSPARPFGPLAGVDPAVRLIEASGAPYTRAHALSDSISVSRQALDEDLARRLRAVGVQPLAQYRAASPGPNADREWSRVALRQGAAPRDVALELVRSGARAQSGPRAQALYASRILAQTIPATPARDLPIQLLATASKILGVPVDVISIARTLLTQAVRLTLGRS